VEIIFSETEVATTTEQDWDAFFADEGPINLDPDLYKRYREFDQRHAEKVHRIE
jgi:hypothetical protein